MIDTAVAAHPALAGVDLRRRDFAGGAPTTAHGTAVASLLANEGAGRIVAASVFRAQGQRHFTSADAIARGLGWLVAEEVPVINMSLAGPRNVILDRLIARALGAGHIVVAAAGNGGPSAPPAYPAALPGVVAVTAVDGRNRIYRYANRGPYIRFAALGVGVPAASAGGALAPHSGTSFASPHVAVRLARCARRIAPGNSACIAAIEREAVDLGPPGRDPVYGAGLIR
jgi:subtilisin family serine protease